jgi:hypothetical protein
LAALGILAAARAAEPPPAEKKPATPAEIAKLDARMKDLSESFLRETTALIGSYESIGEYERAKLLLEALRKLNPGNEAVKQKLADLDRRQLDAEEFTVKLEPGDAWEAVGTVAKDRQLRVRVTGEYRFTAVATVGANGVAAKDTVADLVPGIPLGAVMGLIATPAAGDRPASKPPKPFLVGSEHSRTVDADGILYLKVNLPAGTTCTGGLEAHVGGATKP